MKTFFSVSSAIVFLFFCFTGGALGTGSRVGNLIAEIRLPDADSDTSADPLYLNYMNTCGGDFHLQDTSPCKTSGTTGGEIIDYGLLTNTFTLKDVIVGLKILSGSNINKEVVTKEKKIKADAKSRKKVRTR